LVSDSKVEIWIHKLRSPNKIPFDLNSLHFSRIITLIPPEHQRIFQPVHTNVANGVSDKQSQPVDKGQRPLDWNKSVTRQAKPVALQSRPITGFIVMCQLQLGCETLVENFFFSLLFVSNNILRDAT
jgi:hypothetical protein